MLRTVFNVIAGIVMCVVYMLYLFVITIGKLLICIFWFGIVLPTLYILENKPTKDEVLCYFNKHEWRDITETELDSYTKIWYNTKTTPTKRCNRKNCLKIR